MARELTESAVLICGGTAGIGLETARAFLAAGVRRIMISGRNSERGAKAVHALSATASDAQVRYVQADLSVPDEAEHVINQCMRAYGQIDALVSGAGGDPMPRLLHDIPLRDVPAVINGVTSSVLLPVRAALPHMMEAKSGAIICIASDAGKIPTPGEVCIGAGMAAIAMFCRGLAIEGRRSGIRVNCITPSIVQNTPLYDVLMADPFAGKLFSKAERRAELGVVQPQDIAALIVFLASSAAARLTGQTISVTGGISAA